MHLVILKAFAVFAWPLGPGSSLALARSLVRDTKPRVPGEWSEAERDPGPSARSAKHHIGQPVLTQMRLPCLSEGRGAPSVRHGRGLFEKAYQRGMEIRVTARLRCVRPHGHDPAGQFQVNRVTVRNAWAWKDTVLTLDFSFARGCFEIRRMGNDPFGSHACNCRPAGRSCSSVGSPDALVQSVTTR